ncbi:starch synthase [Rodentibacter caecimuris]|uniref:Glycogen synthase n=1 Tax=Rodentibacter caecimuris TaxID=1796644 RepID=A0AAJ3K5A7_9PAST|nr:glycogen synthase GlgA [Rodentibacter heylii]AOF52609.1 Glycogen synthase, ADP-glucose transglucosylase [Pasteurellaceae bacterium NI1060]MCX2960739.1 glycogen synthase GlgA [Rodentibacter heylii]OOF71862.1 starch synthase [Rodentibacter heylii]OOF76326.1 starch synthase [Rodentibacter heylii]OOF77304.1 starch synthase [Rodentibacter heylii]
MKVLHVCSELYPLLKTGGLADVIGALPFAQKQIGIDARILLPAYPAICRGIGETHIVAEFDNFAGHVVLRYGEHKGVGVYLIDAPHLYDREGNPYHDIHYNDYTDNYKRFALLGWVGAELSTGLDSWWRAEIVHAHDWHAGLSAAYLFNKGKPAKSVFTIHNLAYQGIFHHRHLYEIGLLEGMFHINGLELFGQISYLKAGLYYSDVVTAVSPTYSQEITTEEFAYGLQGLLIGLREQGRLVGILNGVDETIWHPSGDGYIQYHYKQKAMDGKKKNKSALQTYFNLPVSDALLFVMVTRLTEQKGVDLLVESADDLVKQGGQLVILGSGSAHLEEAIRRLSATYPQNIAVKIGYDEALSHLMIAGGDVILVPSRFEPCGLTQLYGLQYGTLPLVRKTGGLADTVVNSTSENIKKHTATGFVFDHANPEELRCCLQEAFALWQEPRTWATIQRNAMEQDFSWRKVAKEYVGLYQRL